MTQKEILEKMAEINPAFVRQVEALLECRAKFCKIVMKPNPEEDNLKRNGSQRVFNVNCRATYERMMKKHIDPNYHSAETHRFSRRVRPARRGLFSA